MQYLHMYMSHSHAIIKFKYYMVIIYFNDIQKKLFHCILCILGCRITVWNRFLAVAIGKPIVTEFLA